MTALLRALREAVGAEHVEVRGTVHEVSPGSPPEVSRLLALASQRKVPVETVQGTRAARGAMRLSLARLCHVLHLDETSGTVHAQAGIRLSELERMLRARKLTLSRALPPGDETLGAALARGTLGSACIGLSAVLADGRAIHVKAAPRRATGPDFSQLFVGGEGRLGVITTAVLRATAAPELELDSAWPIESLDRACTQAGELLRCGIEPEALTIEAARQQVWLRTRLEGSPRLTRAKQALVEQTLAATAATQQPLEGRVCLEVVAPLRNLAAACRLLVEQGAQQLEVRFAERTRIHVRGEIEASRAALGRSLKQAGAQVVGKERDPLLAVARTPLERLLDPDGILRPT